VGEGPRYLAVAAPQRRAKLISEKLNGKRERDVIAFNYNMGRSAARSEAKGGAGGGGGDL
jgi:hypothetical protein